MGERWERDKQRNTNRGLMDMDNGGGLTVEVGETRQVRAMGEKAGQL